MDLGGARTVAGGGVLGGRHRRRREKHCGYIGRGLPALHAMLERFEEFASGKGPYAS
jgi:hypothetical protein